MSKTLKTGTIITGNSGSAYKIVKLISNGTGQGDIYKVSNKSKEIFAFKLFHHGNKHMIEQQIDRLIRRGQATEAYVSPLEKVYIGTDQIGYIMEYIGPEFISAAALCNGIERDGRIVNLDWSQKLSFLASIVEDFMVLNNASLGIYDIKFDNIRINPETMQVKILDNDTIVYMGSKAMVLGTIGFMPSDTMTGKEKPNKYNDAYAIAVFIFMTLLGIHPLEGKRREQQCNENIDRYLFGTHPVYVYHPTDTSNRPIPKDSFGRNQQQAIDKFKRYPKYVKDAFERTFVDGLHDGSKRTTMSEWLEILERLYNDSYICENCGEEYFLDGNDKVCTVCGQELLKPIFMVGDKNIPLYNGMTICYNELFIDNSDHELFKVVETQYNGRFGLENLAAEKAVLRLKNGLEKTFGRNEVIPLFLDGEIEVGHKTIKFN